METLNMRQGQMRTWEPLDRFWAQVGEQPEAADLCWEWTGTTNRSGYGMIRWDGRKQPASRVSWEIANGRPAGDGVVCHICDNPACVRPSHLYLGSHLTNAQDCDRRGRRVVNVMQGEAHGRHVLTTADVLEIRRLLKRGEFQRSIAERFNVNQSAISKIKTGRAWGHLTSTQEA